MTKAEATQPPRRAEVTRRTRETEIQAELTLDGAGSAEVNTGIGFLDHLLDAITRHARFDLSLKATGDLEIDDHHTTEDCGIVFGMALDQALGERRGVRRFGLAYVPLDESLARAVIDLSGRSFASIDLPFHRDMIGELATENVVHLLWSIAMNARLTMHVDLIRGENDHHKAEAACKAVAVALRQAVSVDPNGSADVPSTKGVI